jgi:hypothetical protein
VDFFFVATLWPCGEFVASKNRVATMWRLCGDHVASSVVCVATLWLLDKILVATKSPHGHKVATQVATRPKNSYVIAKIFLK